MKITGLDHIQLAVPRGEEARARSFYGRLLGLDEIAKLEALARRGGCWFRLGEIQLHLWFADLFRLAGKAHPTFSVVRLSVP